MHALNRHRKTHLRSVFHGGNQHCAHGPQLDVDSPKGEELSTLHFSRDSGALAAQYCSYDHQDLQCSPTGRGCR